MDYELRFQSLRDEDEILCFPCDRDGRVDMGAMDRITLKNYLYVRALVGLDYSIARVTRQPVAAPESRREGIGATG